MCTRAQTGHAPPLMIEATHPIGHRKRSFRNCPGLAHRRSAVQPSRRRGAVAVTVALFATVLANATPVGGQVVPTCNGLDATIIGTEGRDNLRGTPGDDVIVGLGGPDRIVGLGGDDTICGGTGRDLIRGNNGRDTIFGEGGRDRIYGGGGRDTIHGMVQSSRRPAPRCFDGHTARAPRPQQAAPCFPAAA